MTIDYRGSQALPTYLIREEDNTLSFPVRGPTGALIEPSVAVATRSKVSVLRPDGTLLVDDQNVTVSDEGVAEYKVTAATVPSTESLGEGWFVRWDLYLGDTTPVFHSFRVNAALIRTRLWCPVSSQDLLDRHPELASQLPYGESSWDKILGSAWQSIELRLLESGRRPYLIVNPWAFREVVTLLSLSRIFRSLSTFTAGTGKYTELSEVYAKEYEREWGRVKLSIDYGDTGTTASPSEGVAADPVIFLSQPPIWANGYNRRNR